VNEADPIREVLFEALDNFVDGVVESAHR